MRLFKAIVFCTSVSTLCQSYISGFSKCSFPSFQTIRLQYSVAQPGDSSAEESFPSFDLDFAEMMSKPLPEWYKEQKREEEKVLRELEAARERVLLEFRAKYDISEEKKAALIAAKQMERAERGRKSKNDQSWLLKALGLVSEVDLNDINDPEETTREKWEVFWENEKKETGFYFPGFFEVFPELKFKWPVWSKRKDGTAIKCKTDQDCQFPQACCNHPIVPGDKFCCTGFGRRIMVPAYQGQVIQSKSPSE